MSTEDRKLIVIEAIVSSSNSGYGDEYDSYDPDLTLSTKEVTLDEFLKLPWVAEELQKRGWVNAAKGKEISEKVTYGSRFYAVVGSPPSWHSALSIDASSLSAQQVSFLGRPDGVLVQEVTLDSIQHLDPKAYKLLENAIQKHAQKEKLAAEREANRKKTQEQKLEAKKKRALDKAIKLLKQEGLTVNQEKKS